MRIFDTHRELNAAMGLPPEHPDFFRFLPQYMPAGYVCCDCGAVKLFQLNSGTGYATTHKGNELICYDCCDKRQREELRDQSEPFYAYLSSDGTKVTTWTGGELGRVYSLGESRSGWHGSAIARFRVKDIHGNYWTGRGAGRGMACTLRRAKGV